MIDDILDLTRIELKSFTLSKSWFNIESIMNEVSEILG